MQWVLQSGRPVADCLVYPVTSSDPEKPPRGEDTDQPVSALNCVDAASRYTFSRIWQGDDNRYEVRNLCLLGDIETLEEARKVMLMIEKGAKVLYCGPKPDRWSAFQKHAVEAEALRKKFDLASAQGLVVDARDRGWRKVIEESRSVRWYPEDALISYQHRRVRGGELYFVMNWGGRFDGEVEFSEKGLIPQIWDADTGKRTVCAQWKVVGGKTRVRLRLGHLESALIAFTAGPEVLHAVECEGAEIAMDQDGRLYALISESRECPVRLSDGTVRKLKATVPKDVRLTGGWTLSASGSDGVGLEATTKVGLESLVSWRQLPQFRHYSGTGHYRTTFDVAAEMLNDDLQVELDLGRVYEVAEVWLNGRRVGVSWYPPHVVDVTRHLREGANELRIDVANILKNHLEQGQYSHPSGLLGPVRIRAVAKIFLGE